MSSKNNFLILLKRYKSEVVNNQVGSSYLTSWDQLILNYNRIVYISTFADSTMGDVILLVGERAHCPGHSLVTDYRGDLSKRFTNQEDLLFLIVHYNVREGTL